MTITIDTTSKTLVHHLPFAVFPMSIICGTEQTQVVMSMPWATGPLEHILQFDPKLVLGPGWHAVTFQHN